MTGHDGRFVRLKPTNLVDFYFFIWKKAIYTTMNLILDYIVYLIATESFANLVDDENELDSTPN